MQAHRVATFWSNRDDTQAMAARPIGTVFNTEDPKLDPTLGGNLESKRSEALSTARSDAVLLPGDQEHGASPPQMDLEGALAKLPTIREQVWPALVTCASWDVLRPSEALLWCTLSTIMATLSTTLQ